MTISVAIVGSGPSAFYTAEALLKSGADVAIDIIERLPAPFGLIRYGVAPDHQTTKNVQRAFDRTAQEKQVAYFGNIEVGRDVSMDTLRELYDAVVLAVGAPLDRPLGVPGEDKRNVFGSAAFVNWYNGHPDFADLNPDLSCETAVVVGNGNVAIDVARVLVKTREEMKEADIAEHALEAIQAGKIRNVHMVGRRGPIEAKFTNVELREMGKLEDAAPVVDPKHLPDSVGVIEDDRDRRLKERNLATLKEFLTVPTEGKSKRVYFDFYAAPVEILGGEKVEAVRFERTKVEGSRAVGTGEFFEIACGLVVAAIGYKSSPLGGLPFDERNGVFKNEDGRVLPGVYAVGWAKRGPTGVIGSNKPDGRIAAEQILTDFKSGGGKPGRAALEQTLHKTARRIDYDMWRKIDAVEVARAPKPAPRRKLVTIKEMLAVLDGE